MIHRLTYVTLEGNPWQCPCLTEILDFFTLKGIGYRKRGYFDGKRPVCVVTPTESCVKNIGLVRKHRIVETYENALSEI